MKKNQVIETLENFPDEFNLEEFVDKLFLMEKIEQAEEDIAQGRVYSLEEVRKKFEDKWQK